MDGFLLQKHIIISYIFQLLAQILTLQTPSLKHVLSTASHAYSRGLNFQKDSYLELIYYSGK